MVAGTSRVSIKKRIVRWVLGLSECIQTYFEVAWSIGSIFGAWFWSYHPEKCGWTRKTSLFLIKILSILYNFSTDLKLFFIKNTRFFMFISSLRDDNFKTMLRNHAQSIRLPRNRFIYTQKCPVPTARMRIFFAAQMNPWAYYLVSF